jgi:exopolysaccharide/PEP-CTERM locus tyrosine autokinase
VSFVEKALQRLKQQEREMAPLGEYIAQSDPDAETVTGMDAVTEDVAVPEQTVTSGPVPADPPRHGAGHVGQAGPRRRVVAVDRSRLREEGFLAPEKYQRRMADEYRRIKRPLIANAFGIGVPAVEDGNLILVTSAVSGEGKTHTCLNLALSLSTERDRTVLLVDGDLPKPHISRLLGVGDQRGLLEALSENPPPLADLIVKTDVPRLSVLPAGQWKDDATELLSSGRMRALCKELAERYPDRIILFDSPPLLAATEAQAIAATVGQVVLVIAENLTARAQVASALSLVDQNKPVNAILNKSRMGGSGYHYGGYGYGYGAHAESEADSHAR